MKKYLLSAIVCTLAFCACTTIPEYSEVNPNRPSEEEVRKNNETIFGTIDPNQDWNMFSSGSVTILANAPLNNIVKVQVLTESPFFNDEATILSEAVAHNGEEVTLSFDAPSDYTRLVAACVDNNNHYYIKGFNIGEKKVNFISSTASTRAMTRAGSFPAIPALTSANAFYSYNAGRTIYANDGTASSTYNQWKNKGWENDHLWGNDNGIYRDAEGLSNDEIEELNDIFSVSLQRNNNGTRVKDNMKYINESSAVRFFDNHLVTDGQNSVIITPINLLSTEAEKCDIYYYYYKDEDIPAGMSKTDYIKLLPKFKAANLNTERKAFKEVTGIAINANDPNFLSLHDYLLPYYGDPAAYMANNMSVKEQGYETDGKFYRIYYTSEKNNIKFITHTSDASKNLKEKYSDNAEDIAEQVWQLFTNSEGKTMLYNVGSKKFLQYIPNSRPLFSSSDSDFDNFCFVICDANNNPTTSKKDVHLIKLYQNKKYCIKGDAETKLAQDGGNLNDRATIRWTFEEYSPSATLAKIDDTTLQIWPATLPTPSDIFDEGYNIGIMLRKGRDKTIDDGKLQHSMNGCLYSYGELNKEINSFGSFNSAVTKYSMQLNSPRIALCNANNKSYLSFEDGSDCNFGDIIIQTHSGIKEIEAEEIDVEYMSYMMCFEDTPLADYDLNDVVLKFQRIDDTHVEVSLVACGAFDELYLKGLNGNVLNGNIEIHEMFGTDQQSYVNTDGNTVIEPITEEFSIDIDMPIWKFMSNVFIFDKTTGEEIKLSEQGESPRAIIVPGNIYYPREKVCMTTAYPDFKAWVNNATENRDWYKYVDEKQVYIHK